MPGVVHSQWQVFELCEVPVRPFLQPAKVLQDGSTTFWEPATPSFVTSRISEDLLCPTIQTVNEGTERCGTQDWGILVVTSLQLDSVPPVATLWMWLFSQVSVHLAVHSPVIHQLLHETSWEKCLYGKTSWPPSRQYSPLFPYLPSIAHSRNTIPRVRALKPKWRQAVCEVSY